MTSGQPSTSQASASLHQQCLLSLSTAWFREINLQRHQMINQQGDREIGHLVTQESYLELILKMEWILAAGGLTRYKNVPEGICLEDL